MIIHQAFDEPTSKMTLDTWNILMFMGPPFPKACWICSFSGIFTVRYSNCFGSADTTVCIWDVVSSVAPHCQSHRGGFIKLHFFPDGTCIVSGSEDGTIQI